MVFSFLCWWNVSSFFFYIFCLIYVWLLPISLFFWNGRLIWFFFLFLWYALFSLFLCFHLTRWEGGVFLLSFYLCLKCVLNRFNWILSFLSSFLLLSLFMSLCLLWAVFDTCWPTKSWWCLLSPQYLVLMIVDLFYLSCECDTSLPHAILISSFSNLIVLQATSKRFEFILLVSSGADKGGLHSSGWLTLAYSATIKRAMLGLLVIWSSEKEEGRADRFTYLIQFKY